MKAARFHKTGPADVIQLDEISPPQPAAGEAVVRVRAAALNRLDVFLRSGISAMPGFQLPHTGGFDMAGDVASVGDEVDPSWVGRPVAVKSRVIGPQAHSRLDVIGITRPGGFAEQVLVPADRLMPKPEGYSFEEAAAYGCVYLTAYYGLLERAGLRPGETVLVHAAGSGAGSSAIQVAKAAGATVITTAGSDEKCAKARELLGADHAVNYRKQDFRAVVNDVTGGRGVDVAFDPVWGGTAPQTLEAMALGGRWIVLGMVGGFDGTLNAGRLLFREITVRGIVEFYASDDQIDAAWRLAHQGRVRPIIARSWPLSETAAAHRQMETGDFFGKIVIIP